MHSHRTRQTDGLCIECHKILSVTALLFCAHWLQQGDANYVDWSARSYYPSQQSSTHASNNELIAKWHFCNIKQIKSTVEVMCELQNKCYTVQNWNFAEIPTSLWKMQMYDILAHSLLPLLVCKYRQNEIKSLSTTTITVECILTVLVSASPMGVFNVIVQCWLMHRVGPNCFVSYTYYGTSTSAVSLSSQEFTLLRLKCSPISNSQSLLHLSMCHKTLWCDMNITG